MEKTIKATNETIKEIVKEEIERLGNNADLNFIDVSEVTDMTRVFYKSKFNGDVSRWNVSNVEKMRFTFYRSNFNGDISQWNVSNVRDMFCMFEKSIFNGDISQWNVSNVTDMRFMFTNSPLEEKYGTNGDKLNELTTKKITIMTKELEILLTYLLDAKDCEVYIRKNSLSEQILLDVTVTKQDNSLFGFVDYVIPDIEDVFEISEKSEIISLAKKIVNKLKK